MDNYCILRIEKVHSMGDLQTRHEHNFRELQLPHVDIALSEKNEELVDFSGMDYKDLWYQRMKDIELETGSPVTTRKGSVLAYEIVTSFSNGADVDVDEWKEANKQWLFDTFGPDNVLSMQLHLDETTPHIHTIVTPIDERGHLCAKSFTGGRAKMRQLQTSYADAMEPFGLSRGEMYSKAKNSDLKKFYSAVSKKAKTKAPRIEANESVEEYEKRVDEYIRMIELASLSNEMKYQRQIDIANSKIAQIYGRYGDAIELQRDLELKFDGDEDMVRNRLVTYRKVEHSVPRKVLNSLLDNLQKKFPLKENIFFFKDKKKKKKKEIEIL